MERRGECLVILVREDVVDARVLEEVLLDAQGQVEYRVRRVGVAVRFLHLFHEHAQGEVELVRSEVKDCKRLVERGGNGRVGQDDKCCKTEK